MTVAAHWGVGEVLWSIFWFFIFFLWIWLVVMVFADIIRSELSGFSKMIWAIAIIFLPYIGVFSYLLVHGDGMNKRRDPTSASYEQNVQNYPRDANTPTKSASDELADLAALHHSGAISEREFEQAKAKVIA